MFYPNINVRGIHFITLFQTGSAFNCKTRLNAHEISVRTHTYKRASYYIRHIKASGTRQWIELPFTIHWLCSSLPVYTLGRVSKLSWLLHKEIKPSDMPINGCLDWWVSYLDEQFPRGLLCLTAVRDRKDATALIVKVTLSDYVTQQTNQKEIIQQALTAEAMQSKKGKVHLSFFSFCKIWYIFL